MVFPSYAGLVTATVAVAGLLVTMRQHFRQRQADLQQRQVEERRRLDEHFNQVVTNLASETKALQASAAAALFSFLRDNGDTPPYTPQIFRLLQAQLKIDRGREVNQLLGEVFSLTTRLYLNARTDSQPLDLSRSFLSRADLTKLDLDGADLGFAVLDGALLRDTKLKHARGYEVSLEGAVLSGADLTEARFRKANAPRAVFHDAIMPGIKLQEAMLEGAEFQRSKLQSAHFEGASLAGAAFEQADINDAFFAGASFDQRALGSIVKAKNWNKAHFDDAIAAQLGEMR